MKGASPMLARSASRIVRRYCGCCGDELTAHQALSSGICGKQRCRDWKIAEVGAALLERRRREVMERHFDEQAPVVARAAAAIGATSETVVCATIPWQGSPVAPLSQERRADFAEHLRQVVADAFSAPTSPEALVERQPVEADEAPVTATACAACRGQCCSRGGETAFLGPADIARWRRSAPEAPPDEIVAWYLGMLPAETIAAGCVFQGDAGCVLPRERRSDHCNVYHCRSLQALHARLGEAADPDAKVVMIVDDEAADAARGVVGWSAATGAVGFVAIRAPDGPPVGAPLPNAAR